MTKSVFTDEYKIMLEILIETRRKGGIQQTELATKLGRPQPFVSYIERGERRIDVVEFIMIARALNADATELFSVLNDRLSDDIEI